MPTKESRPRGHDTRAHEGVQSGVHVVAAATEAAPEEAQAAENEWNQRADTHAQQLFSQEQANTLQVESDFQRLQPSQATSLLEAGAARHLDNLNDATTSMVTRAKDWDTRHAQIDKILELRSEVQRVLTDFRTRAQEEYLAATEQLRRTTLSDMQRSIGQIQAEHGAKDLPLQFELTALQADAQQRDMGRVESVSNVCHTFRTVRSAGATRPVPWAVQDAFLHGKVKRLLVNKKKYGLVLVQCRGVLRCHAERGRQGIARRVHKGQQRQSGGGPTTDHRLPSGPARPSAAVHPICALRNGKYSAPFLSPSIPCKKYTPTDKADKKTSCNGGDVSCSGLLRPP